MNDDAPMNLATRAEPICRGAQDEVSMYIRILHADSPIVSS
jgi:hypothetical protein